MCVFPELMMVFHRDIEDLAMKEKFKIKVEAMVYEYKPGRFCIIVTKTFV